MRSKLLDSANNIVRTIIRYKGLDSVEEFNVLREGKSYVFDNTKMKKYNYQSYNARDYR